jgi:hypothetical protein
LGAYHARVREYMKLTFPPVRQHLSYSKACHWCTWRFCQPHWTTDNRYTTLVIMVAAMESLLVIIGLFPMRSVMNWMTCTRALSRGLDATVLTIGGQEDGSAARFSALSSRHTQHKQDDARAADRDGQRSFQWFEVTYFMVTNPDITDEFCTFMLCQPMIGQKDSWNPSGECGAPGVSINAAEIGITQWSQVAEVSS